MLQSHCHHLYGPDCGFREQVSRAAGHLPSERSSLSAIFMTVTRLGSQLPKPALTAAHTSRRLPPPALSSRSRFASLNSTEPLGFPLCSSPCSGLWGKALNSVQTPQPWPLGRVHSRRLTLNEEKAPFLTSLDQKRLEFSKEASSKKLGEVGHGRSQRICHRLET